jgi:hypothetical protein
VVIGMGILGAKHVKPKKWTMPAWMKPYAEHIFNTGGNDIEDMMNGDASPLINLPLFTLQACVKSQVLLLEILHREGKLR